MNKVHIKNCEIIFQQELNKKFRNFRIRGQKFNIKDNVIIYFCSFLKPKRVHL